MSRDSVKDVSLTADEITLVKTLLVESMLRTKQHIERLEHLGYDQFANVARKDFNIASELMKVL